MKRNTSHVATRPQIERLFRIVAEIRQGGYPNCATFQKTFEVNRRTIMRDIEFLRDRLLAPLEYDRGRRGYFLTADFNLMPRLDLGHEDVFTLHFIRESLAPYEHTEIGSAMKKSFDRMFTLLIGAKAWKTVEEAGDISRAASSFRAGVFTKASQ